MSCWDYFIDILPVICVLTLFIWSYYCYMYEMCWKMVKSLAKQLAYGIIFNLLFVMVMWCYFATMCTLHEEVPDYFTPPFTVREAIRIAESEEISNILISKFCATRRIVIKTRNVRGFIRYCYFCKHIKPDRTHHCSDCETCILKMDHHCPWVAACIGFANYKNFLLFLFYTSLYLLFSAATMVEYCLIYLYIPMEEKDFFTIQVVLGCGLGFSIGVVVLIFFIYHMRLVFLNETTLEAMTEPKFADNEDITFNISPRYNFLQVFGYDVGLWFIPLGWSPGNGVTFYTTWK